MDKTAGKGQIARFAKGTMTKMIDSLKKGKKNLYDAPFNKLPVDVRKGYERMARESGSDSFLLSIPGWLPGKAGNKWKKMVAENVSMPITKMDTALGELAGKVTGGGDLFKIKEKVPVAPSFTGRQIKKVTKEVADQAKKNKLAPVKEPANQLYKEVNRSSITAPATKTMGVVVPFAGAYAIDEQLGKMMGNKNKQDQKKTASANLVTMEKTAAVKLATELIRLKGETSKLAQANANHEKRAKAEELVYKQASMGLMAYPKSYQELQEKVASLENQDLDVLEKALQLQVGDVSMGKVASETGTIMPTTPESQFAADLLEDEDSLF